MKHSVVFLTAAAALVCANAASQPVAANHSVAATTDAGKAVIKSATEPGPAEVRQLADAADNALANADYEKAADLYRIVIDSSSFTALDIERRHFALSSAAEIASMHSDFARARTLYARSSEHELAGSDDWMGRLNASWFLGDLDDAIRSLSVVAENWPAELDFVSEWAMKSLLAHARKNHAEVEFMVLQKLFETNWQTDLGAEPTHMWLRLIELLAESNAIEPALNVSSRLRDPLAVASILSDQRFSPIVEAAPEWFSVEEAMDAGIIEARLAVEANPHLLAPSIALAEALLHAGRHEEALLVSDTHLARAALKAVIGEKLEDVSAQTVRALTVKALALIALSRYDEAAATLELAASQVLPLDRLGDFVNVARLQASLGLPDAAITTLERLAALPDDARSYFVRFIAARAYSDSNAQKAALRALVARAGESPAEAQRALLLAGDVDAAAELLIRRLNDPAQRSTALLELQGMHEQQWPNRALDWRASAVLLTSREDVRESVAAAGGIVSDFAIYRWN